jgi:hypothetical protein
LQVGALFLLETLREVLCIQTDLRSSMCPKNPKEPLPVIIAPVEIVSFHALMTSCWIA